MSSARQKRSARTQVRFTKLNAKGQATRGAHVAVVDNTTGLMWDAGETARMTWSAAKTHCEQLRAAGFDDWRLPTVAELVALVDYCRCNPAIDTTAFPNCKSDWYWTGVAAAYSPGVCAWFVGFALGFAGWLGQGGDCFVRAVRASQSLAIGHSG
jgi:hypothetical protein